jgi:hypothetical protein
MGRKKANYQTTVIAFRVRVEWVEKIKQAVKNEKKRLENDR